MKQDPAHVAARLTVGQRNRLVKLARAGQSLRWGQSDDALEVKRLVRRYSGAVDGEFADLTGDGSVVAQWVARRA